MPIPTLSTDRLILRPLRREDSAAMFEFTQDEAVAWPGMWEPFPTFEACEEQVAQIVSLYEADLMWWGVELRENGRMIGGVQLVDWNQPDARAEIGYALHRDFWGQGLMTEAVHAVAGYAWESLELHRLSATLMSDNIASVKILKGLGMELEGRMKHFRKLWGEWIDVDLYAAVSCRSQANERAGDDAQKIAS